ncbi:membrane-associated protein, putative [Bodo saltans]|uniref:Membrane-associated protein, putative n=1 Tax=Bodo saltans TaxID=75058 RepID=A0A0S4JIN7_BODSA|nr:membrane-associated protein, putative [Bodo saltans]|eukprot:CUG89104.1 membrane-associated protein, putative [Bodo saltans]
MRHVYSYVGRIGVLLFISWIVVCLCRSTATPHTIRSKGHVMTIAQNELSSSSTVVSQVGSEPPPPSPTAGPLLPSPQSSQFRQWPVFESLAARSSQRRSTPPLVRLVEQATSSTLPGSPARNKSDVIRVNYRGQYGWRFQKYISSTLEDSFYEDMKQLLASTNDPSNAVYEIERYQANASMLIAMGVGRVFPNEMGTDHSKYLAQCDTDDDDVGGPGVASPPQCLPPLANSTTSALSDCFSRFVFVFECLGEPCDPVDFPHITGWVLGETHTTWIEPLFGAMRHPKFLLDAGKRTYLEDKGYMAPDKWALHNLHTRYKKRFPSLLRSGACRSSSACSGACRSSSACSGACRSSSACSGACRSVNTSLSNYGACPILEDRRDSIFIDMGASTYGAGTGGSSQNWFVAAADCLCVPFTEMFLFEAKKHKANSVWRNVPDPIHPAYHWYNYLLNSSLASWRNPLNHLLSKLHPNDVVTVKVDFDAPELEAQIIDTILRFPELYQTIDELFFEHHVTMPYMNQYWREKAAGLTIVDSIDLFRSLRRKGIRAHSWV